MNQMIYCPQKLYFIGKQQGVYFGHGKGVFGFQSKADALNVKQILSSNKVDLHYFPRIVPYKFKLQIQKEKVSDVRPYFIDEYIREEYMYNILGNNMSIYCINEIEKDIHTNTMSLVVEMKAEPEFDTDSQLNWLENLYKK